MEHRNELFNILRSNNWTTIIERLGERHKVKIMQCGNEISNFINPPLETHCPNHYGNIPLFECLRKSDAPFSLIKKMIGEKRTLN